MSTILQETIDLLICNTVLKVISLTQCLWWSAHFGLNGLYCQGYWSHSWRLVSHIVSCINKYCIYPATCNPILIRIKKRKMELRLLESQSRTKQPTSKGKGVPGAGWIASLCSEYTLLLIQFLIGVDRFPNQTCTIKLIIEGFFHVSKSVLFRKKC